MTLGAATNAKYRSVSILITEQINLYLKVIFRRRAKDVYDVFGRHFLPTYIRKIDTYVKNWKIHSNFLLTMFLTVLGVCVEVHFPTNSSETARIPANQ